MGRTRNFNLQCQYVEFVEDRWLVSLGNERVYNVMNPFDSSGSGRLGIYVLQLILSLQAGGWTLQGLIYQ